LNKQLYSVALNTIDVGERLRPVDPDYVALLAASMAERGQDTPIVISAGSPDGNHRLIAGAHRLAAAQSLGWEEIEALVSVTGRTGVEMEALTAVSVAALTVYDMVKAVDRGMRIEAIHLALKEGGKSGRFEAAP